jgi:carboxypeptidase Taq
LFSGAVKVADLPRVWAEKMKEYLGIVTETDTLGVLQDTHWSAGLFGCKYLFTFFLSTFSLAVRTNDVDLGFFFKFFLLDFPTYSLGAIYAAQIFETAEKVSNFFFSVSNEGSFDLTGCCDCCFQAIPNLQGEIRSGNFGPLRAWLRTNIHEKGSVYNSGDELCIAVTGKPLDASGFVRYLEKKYGALYGFARA